MRPVLDGERRDAFEDLIYLPMVLAIFQKDRVQLGKLGFKLPAPYQELIGRAMACAERDLRKSRMYLKNHAYKMDKGEQDDYFTEYIFFYEGYEDRRKYLNLRLRNRTEELMSVYLLEGSE